MPLEIKWTVRAEIQFNNVLDYWTERNQSRTYSHNLIDMVDEALIGLSRFPESGRQTENESIRIKIVRDYFIYYSFDEKELQVIDICDMRRDPNYIKSLLE